MAPTADFLTKLEVEVQRQLASQRVGYLLGAGSSYLDGRGYPLAAKLWKSLRDRMVDATLRDAIQAKLDGGASGIEQALDLLDDGGAGDTPYRHAVTDALAQAFMPMAPPVDAHSEFVHRISRRSEPCVKVFSLNYDPLMERAAEQRRVRLIDGFLGHEQAFFNVAVFAEAHVQVRGPRARPTANPAGTPVHLFKLHGSLGWYELPRDEVRRCAFGATPPGGAKRLMIPPQHRKGRDVALAPYSPLWTAFRGAMSHDAKPLLRLVTAGYGLADEHVNDVIEAAMARRDFTLLVFARGLSNSAWERWSRKENAVVVTESRCALRGEVGPGHEDLWKFETLANKV